MLTLIACVSLPAFAAPLLLSFFPSPKESILARQLPRLGPSLRVWAVVVVILALCFAVDSRFRSNPGLFVRLSACDAAFILLSASHLMCCRTSPRDLWGLGFSVGLIGLASMPHSVVR